MSSNISYSEISNLSLKQTEVNLLLSKAVLADNKRTVTALFNFVIFFFFKDQKFQYEMYSKKQCPAPLKFDPLFCKNFQTADAIIAQLLSTWEYKM